MNKLVKITKSILILFLITSGLSLKPAVTPLSDVEANIIAKNFSFFCHASLVGLSIASIYRKMHNLGPICKKKTFLGFLKLDALNDFSNFEQRNQTPLAIAGGITLIGEGIYHTTKLYCLLTDYLESRKSRKLENKKKTYECELTRLNVKKLQIELGEVSKKK